ncbi:PVC-type heme-binding CxxCH protein [Prosthecobacter debontii]|nr:PVC-type heme-binding CxxCH protein [Prosthecobacter debontii]
MFRLRLLPLLSLLLTAPSAFAARTGPPTMPEVPAEIAPAIEILQPGVKMTLLAEHPDLVTPTGIDVDAKDQIWLIACHTHFRPANYPGPAKDEILIFDAEGKNRRVFYNRTEATMNLLHGPDGWLYLAERSRILRVKDSDGDGMGDVEETLARLETVEDYPHNGLSGMAWHPDGGLVFSLGENFAKEWTLIGQDGTRLTGRGEGGIFRCAADGKGLRRIARGFWNPFGLRVTKAGEIFAAENDPGSRPPCRLLHIVEGADYGYQRTYGNAAVHPFVAWNGELRGTLGMVHPCGEGPCSILDLGGGVLIPSWSDHRLDYFPLTRQGAGYRAERIELLHGSDFFRPVGMARGPDGTLYLTDWVFSSYPIHGRGRLWKLEVDPKLATWIKPLTDPHNEATALAQKLRSGEETPELAQLMGWAKGSDPYIRDAALTALARSSKDWTPESVQAMPAEDQPWAVVALRQADFNDEKWARSLLGSTNPEVQFECLRWISDADMKSFAPDVEHLLTKPDLSYRLFEAALATWNTLRGEPEAGVTSPDVLAARVQDTASPPLIRSYALRLLPPTHKSLTISLLKELLALNQPRLTAEVAQCLAGRNAPEAYAVLAEIAANPALSLPPRLTAIAALSISPRPEDLDLVVKLAGDQEPAIQQEAQRALRFTTHDKLFALNPLRPPFSDTTAWLRLLDSLPGQADVEAGRRLFFHPKIGLCASCHRHTGRGNIVGPDLTFVAAQGDRTAILRSILEPQREVAPQFYPIQLKLADGSDFIGILLRSSDTEVYRDITGKERTFKKHEILSRTELKTSLMPPGLVASLTDAELRDLLAFLMTPAAQ